METKESTTPAQSGDPGLLHADEIIVSVLETDADSVRIKLWPDAAAVRSRLGVLEMAMGAIAEITDYEVERVVANIIDPNTNATAKRKITITLTFAPDDYRQQIGMDAQAKTTLAPIQPVRTSLCITKGRDGSLLLAEMTPQVPGQVDMDGDESPVPAMARVGRAGY